MLDIADALKICHDTYPNGPETLAAHLGIEVVKSELDGCDGWCIQKAGIAKIRLNKDVPEVRQRFTLAHELAHLLQGTKPDVQERGRSSLGSDKAEEKAANQLAAEMLLPRDRIESAITEYPLGKAWVRRLAKQSKVSEVTVALRVSNLAHELDMVGAATIAYENNAFKWCWSKSLTLSKEQAEDLLARVTKASPQLYRAKQKSGKIAVAFALGGDTYQSVFLQLLAPELGESKSREEKIRSLEEWVFSDHSERRSSLAGCFGSFKAKNNGLSLDAAVKQFNEKYLPRWTGHFGRKMRDPRGQDYIRLRLGQWYPEE